MSRKNEMRLLKRISVVPWVNVVLCCPHIPASIAARVAIKKKFIRLSQDAYSQRGARQRTCGRLRGDRVCAGTGSAGGPGLRGFAVCCLSRIRDKSAPAEIYVQEDYISLGEGCAWPGWGSRAHFHKYQIYCDITASVFLLSERGENEPNNSTRLNRLFPFSCIKGTLPYL